MDLVCDDESTEPGTHAILIGVGNYPHATGQGAASSMVLNSLQSPHRSVLQLAEWLRNTQNGFHNPTRPLRSLSILCSPPSGRRSKLGTKTLPHATWSNVEAALLAWKQRADRNSENVALFYFCGHGMSFGDSENLLLLEDVGVNQDNPLDHAIAFDTMRAGLQVRCSAEYQIYFVDACRNPIPLDHVIQFRDRDAGRSVFGGRLSAVATPRQAPTFFASGLGASAYGNSAGPSIFTQALLDSFLGSSAREGTNAWEIQIQAIAEGINRCLSARTAGGVPPQVCQPRDSGSDFSLHELRSAPEVMMKISTRDASRLSGVELSHRELSENAPTKRQPPEAEPWWVRLKRGAYEFRAVDVSSNSCIGTAIKDVIPPGSQVTL